MFLIIFLVCESLVGNINKSIIRSISPTLFFNPKISFKLQDSLLGIVFLNLLNMSMFHEFDYIPFHSSFSELKISHQVLLFIPLIISINLSGFSSCFMTLMEHTE